MCLLAKTELKGPVVGSVSCSPCCTQAPLAGCASACALQRHSVTHAVCTGAAALQPGVRPGRLLWLSPACLRLLLCPFPCLVKAPCSEQKQDIGSRKEGVFWCFQGLRWRTYHCEGVREPRPVVGYRYACTGFYYSRLEKDRSS